MRVTIRAATVFGYSEPSRPACCSIPASPGAASGGNDPAGINVGQRPREIERGAPIVELIGDVEHVTRHTVAVAPTAVVEHHHRVPGPGEHRGIGVEPERPRRAEPVRHHHRRRTGLHMLDVRTENRRRAADSLRREPQDPATEQAMLELLLLPAIPA